MSDNGYFTWLTICIVVLSVSFCGEPDLIDALVTNMMQQP